MPSAGSPGNSSPKNERAEAVRLIATPPERPALEVHEARLSSTHHDARQAEASRVWLPSQSWYLGTAREPELTEAGSFRLDDAQGELGYRVHDRRGCMTGRTTRSSSPNCSPASRVPSAKRTRPVRPCAVGCDPAEE
jgi:hypothetical protein